jgi:hypothetical protein
MCQSSETGNSQFDSSGKLRTRSAAPMLECHIYLDRRLTDIGRAVGLPAFRQAPIETAPERTLAPHPCGTCRLPHAVFAE